MATKKNTRHRNAKDGKYVTKEYAEKNPDTTVTEKDRVPTKKN